MTHTERHQVPAQPNSEGWKAYPGAVTHRTHPTHHTCVRKEKLKDFRDQKLEIKTVMESSSFPPGSRVPCTAVSAAPRARQSTGQSGIREQRHSRGHSAAPGRSPAPGTAGQGRRCFGICRRKQRPSQGNRRKNGNGPIAVSPFRPPFPGEGRTAGAERLGGSGGTGSQAASEWGPSPAGHPIPPGTGSPSLPGQSLPFPSRPAGAPAGLTDSAAAARRRRPSSSAARSGTRGSGMAGLCRDTQSDEPPDPTTAASGRAPPPPPPL